MNTRAGVICELRLVKKVCPKIKSLEWGQGRVWRRRALSNLWWIMNQTTPHSVQYSLLYHLDDDPRNKTIFSYALFEGLHILGPTLYLCLIILPSLVLLNTTNLGKCWIHLPKLLKVPPFCPFPSLVSKIPFSRSNTWSMLTFKHSHKVVFVCVKILTNGRNFFSWNNSHFHFPHIDSHNTTTKMSAMKAQSCCTSVHAL